MIKRIRVKKPPQLLPGVDKAPDVRSFEKWVVENAAYFRVVQKTLPGRATPIVMGGVDQFPTLTIAIKARGDNERRMIYAVTAEGRSVMIGPLQFDDMLKLRGEPHGDER